MSTRPIITIFGATGAQGEGLARAILADPSRSFAVRAATRNPDGAAARALAAAGAEIVPVDLDVDASLEQAMHGTYGVFAVTNGCEHIEPEREFVHAGLVARAAQRVNARHVIWSALADAGGEANALLRDLPTTFLRTSFTWDSLLHVGMGPQRAADGVLELALPMGDRLLPGIAAADIGPCALGIFQGCGQFIGRTVGIAGEHLRGAAMAQAFARALGEPVRYVSMSFMAYAQRGFPGAAELANTFRYPHDCNEEYCTARSVASTRELHPNLFGFEQWLDEQVGSTSTQHACRQHHQRAQEGEDALDHDAEQPERQQDQPHERP